MTVTKYHLIFLAIYSLALISATWFFTKPKPISNTGLTIQNQHLVDSLSTAVTLLEYRQKEKDSLIQLYRGDIVVLDVKIKATKNEITNIKQKYEKELADIKRYNVADLNEFFTNRYK
jgi:hypothetical protein